MLVWRMAWNDTNPLLMKTSQQPKWRHSRTNTQRTSYSLETVNETLHELEHNEEMMMYSNIQNIQCGFWAITHQHNYFGFCHKHHPCLDITLDKNAQCGWISTREHRLFHSTQTSPTQEEKDELDKRLCCWSTSMSRENAATTIDNHTFNFPNKWAGKRHFDKLVNFWSLESHCSH